MFEIIEHITNGLAQFLRENSYLKKYFFATGFVLIVSGACGILYLELWTSKEIQDKLLPLFVFGIILGIYTAGVLILSSARQQESAQDQELAPLRKERITLEEKIGESPDIFDTIKLNLNQLSEYYIINKNQAKNSFRASMMAIIIGFATILAGIWFFYLSSNPNKNLTYLSLIGGVTLQFVGGAYFYLHNKSILQLNFFFQRLTTVQDTMLSIGLVDRIHDSNLKANIYENLINKIMNRNYDQIKSVSKERKNSRDSSGASRLQRTSFRQRSRNDSSPAPADNHDDDTVRVVTAERSEPGRPLRRRRLGPEAKRSSA